MKAIKKHIILIVSTTLLIVSILHSRRGHHGHHDGYGGYYAIPFALGALSYLAAESDSPRYYGPPSNYRSFQDNADEQYWVITNNTGKDIIVENKNGGPQKMIRAGQTTELSHRSSFGFRIIDAQTRQEIGQGRSEDHFISIDKGGFLGRVSTNTWN